MSKLSIGEVIVNFPAKLKTIICRNCSMEFIVYCVFRYNDEYTMEERIDFIEQAGIRICPYCGENPHKKEK